MPVIPGFNWLSKRFSPDSGPPIDDDDSDAENGGGSGVNNAALETQQPFIIQQESVSHLNYYEQSSSQFPTPHAHSKAPSRSSALPPANKRSNVTLSGIPPPPPPRRTLSNSFRHRSLSKVFNQLPNRLPTRREAEMDVLEYYLHVMLLETDHGRFQRYQSYAQDLLKSHPPRKYGRLFVRVLLTALLGDVCGPWAGRPSDQADAATYLIEYAADFWRDVRGSLVSLQQQLLHLDANVYVPSAADGDDLALGESSLVLPNPNKTMDHELAKHEMFQDDYHEVLRLLDVQNILVSFRDAVEEVKDARDTAAIGAAIANYETALMALFGGGSNTNAHDPRVIPTTLSRFLLSDMHPDRGSLHQSLLECVEAVMVADMSSSRNAGGSNNNNVYSHAVLQSKMRALLTKWSEKVLDIPELVKLGYGGVTAPILDDGLEDDDLSSLGSAAGPAAIPVADNNDDPLPPNAAVFERRTPAEREVLSHLREDAMEYARKSPRRMPQNMAARGSSSGGGPHQHVSSRQQSHGNDNRMAFKDDNDDDDDEVVQADSNRSDGKEPRTTPPRSAELAPWSRSKGSPAAIAVAASPRRKKASPPRVTIIRRKSSPPAASPPRKRVKIPMWDAETRYDLPVLYPSAQDYGEKTRGLTAMTPPRSAVAATHGGKRNGSPSRGGRAMFGSPTVPHYFWTEDETMALQEGLIRLGRKYAEIKRHDARLKNRSNRQVADKVRTMLKAGELREDAPGKFSVPKSQSATV